jgi:transaldolase/transaldolase/glucose-6-phosphate isomerase
VLWASTSTKNPAYSDTLYVDELVGPNTVNTMPPQTIDAFRDHGVVDPTALTSDVDAAEAQIRALADLGVDFDDITETLQTEGVQAFADSADELLAALEGKMRELRD